jgi:hypothetical protein
MPARLRRENVFIERFLSAYEDFSWSKAAIRWLDEEKDGAVEALATRPDGRTLAVEHTIIEPFSAEKEDFAFFSKAFLDIEKDSSLTVPEPWIEALVPVGILRGKRKPADRAELVRGVHDWLRAKRLGLPEGFSEYKLPIRVSGGKSYEIPIYVRVTPISGKGSLTVRRQQMEDTLSEVIERALARKLPKLVLTEAGKHLLILERQHMNLFPSRILEKIDGQRSKFPELSSVDEIWILETMFYDREGYLRFERFQSDELASSLDFRGAELLDKFENGVVTLGPAANRS